MTFAKTEGLESGCIAEKGLKKKIWCPNHEQRIGLLDIRYSISQIAFSLTRTEFMHVNLVGHSNIRANP